MSVFEPNPDPDAVEVPEPYTDEQAADSEGGRFVDPHAERMLDGGDATFGRTDDGYEPPPERESDVFTGQSGWTYSYDPREGYDLGDPKRDGPGGYW